MFIALEFNNRTKMHTTVYTRVQVEFFGRENGLKKIDLDLYSGEHETYLQNHKKNAKIHCNKPSYGVK